MELIDAATAATEALTEAEAAQIAYEDGVGDPEGPLDDLVATLLETGGDDGQALVDALSQTYARVRQFIDTKGPFFSDRTMACGRFRKTPMSLGVQPRFRIGGGGFICKDFSRLDASGRGSVTCHRSPFGPDN